MKCIGLRCSNNDYSFAILSGSKEAPNLEESGTVNFPKGYSRTQSLKWFLQELEEISKKYELERLAIKGAEGIAARGKEFVTRVENEAMALLLAANLGIDEVQRKVKSTIAKDLGLPGKAQALKTELDTNLIPEFKTSTDKIKEAILVAWSSL